ncbi:hypothetical protein APH_0760 [Anaplasma phagocytophilum str. HZ]|uniref:Uncharacterized protein n=1 Tax=Anaplasma phagocytophilum (strain HZ) TaxID=212042 RepID=Q2GJW2_ANAPZ|nr:hypothetical protein APH_0760 [Anaplasma phagocytophilum str. HZ]
MLITHSFFCCIIIICCALFTSLKSVILGKASNRYREDLPSNFKKKHMLVIIKKIE